MFTYIAASVLLVIDQAGMDNIALGGGGFLGGIALTVAINKLMIKTLKEDHKDLKSVVNKHFEDHKKSDKVAAETANDVKWLVSHFKNKS